MLKTIGMVAVADLAAIAEMLFPTEARMSDVTSSRLSAAGQRARSRKAADEDAFFGVVFEFVGLEMSDFQPKQRQYVRT